MKRTQQEIDNQIKGLESMKTWLPEKSSFGDNNWKAIDAQISVLKEIKSASFFNNDEDHVYSSALDAEEWMDGTRDEDLFETE